MSDSSSQPIPTALVGPIIDGYAHAMRPAVAFILIATAFGSLLIPLMILLFALSTPQTRRKPIFILNVLSVGLGILTAALAAHQSIQSILSSFKPVPIAETLVYLILFQWTPWVAESVLLVRIAVVFSRKRLPLLLAFPVMVKIARAVLTIIFCVKWATLVLRGLSAELNILDIFPRWLFGAPFFLELFDNSYVSFLFLWRLGLPSQSSFIEGTAVGRVSFSKSNQSYASKLQTLFWIAATNFVFPLIFGVIEIITLFRGTDIVLPVAVNIVNAYVTIICTVFATGMSNSILLLFGPDLG
ncbi:hypothetical protein FB451DRAFT_1241185 [Mycena latifolia]|nr:hypothetical protein FB451DRAFT_1241185 [Mycena latifolia]